MTNETVKNAHLNEPSVDHRSLFLSLTIVFGTLVPLVGALLLNATLSEWFVTSMPFHSTVEVMGAMFGLVLASVVLFSRHKPCTSRRLKVVCALISMGVLDIFHSCVFAGNSFVWLRSISVLFGGIFFACVWLPERERPRKQVIWASVAVLLGSILVGVLSSYHAGWIPTMVVNGQFTSTALAINFLGGWLTIIGGIAFAFLYYKNQALEDLVFLFLCIIFGSFGILFNYAGTWGAGWWFGHVIRFGGYILPFWLVVFASRLAEERAVTKQIEIATAVAKGDYAVSVVLRNDEDELGSALRSMVCALKQNKQQRDESDWIKTARVKLDDVMRGEKGVPQLATDIITCIARLLDVPIGTFSVADDERTQLVLTGSFAYTKKDAETIIFAFGEGLIGQAAQEKRRIVVDEVPQDYLTLVSSIGKLAPANILCIPFLYDEEVAGVIELGALKEFSELQLRFLDQVVEQIAIAIHAAQSREKMQVLLQESQEQTEELQTQQEELRVANEELAEKNDELVDHKMQFKKESRSN